MADKTGISWADGTLNFWVGCTKVSVGEKGACVNCYAETWSKRFPAFRDTWGAGAPRVKTKGALAKARGMERKAREWGRPYFCFSNSLSDIFDNEVPIEWLAEAFDIMRQTPHVIYLLLTKRGNFLKRVQEAGGLPPNAALGMTMVTQDEVDQHAPSLAIAAGALKPAFTFISIEPMMEEIDLTRISTLRFKGAEIYNALTGDLSGLFGEPSGHAPKIDWVIVGFESGPNARVPNPFWARQVRDQCARTSAVFHFKQHGEWAPDDVGEPHAGHRTVVIEDGSPEGQVMFRLGTKNTGRLLDGVVHDARPHVAS